MRQETQGFPLVRLLLQTAQKLLALGSVPQEQRGSCRKGPRERRMADFCARGAHAVATRCLAACDQAAIRGAGLPAGDTVALMHCVEHHEAEDVPNPGDGLEQREGMSLVGLGGVQDGELQVLEPCIVLGDERQSDCEGFLPRRRMQALGPPVAGGCGGDVRADLGPVVLAMGIVHVRAKRSALAPQRRTTPHEVTGGAHLSRIDVCLWQPTPAQPSGHLVGIDRVVCGFPAVD